MPWKANGSLAFICPRYGMEVLGGAELVVRQMAERLVVRDLPVEVLTTCAIDHHTWRNEFAPGLHEVNGVKVRRFETRKSEGRMHAAIGRNISQGTPLSLYQQELWINDNFRVPDLYHYLRANHDLYHTLLLTPYMFWTTYACSQVAPSKTVLRPCLHDEPFAYLDIYKPMFRDARGIIFNSPPEADLAQRIFELPKQTSIVGEGVDVPSNADAERFRSSYGIEGDFLLYAGRREWGKNVDTLVSFFSRYRAQLASDLRLVLIGKGPVSIPADASQHVLDLGYVDDQVKNDAFAAASVVCQPSRWESFSRLLMEAWLGSTPVLAYGGCEVTAYHTLESRGGFVYEDFYDFAAGLDVLLQNPLLAANLGEAGRAYVLANFMWDDVIDRLVGRIDDWSAEISEN